ncbi:uncharacterized protein LOC120006075 [Tripterygium wilfordii]|uniref:uncharacterized protein LOC120006075 n=1 Tax=Tripterygium wilfordii TaxID=458696 RepID=UPI0018F7E839|nr:uncharacterized protein LOC120006075 [Tripterygium wilfordii]
MYSVRSGYHKARELGLQSEAESSEREREVSLWRSVWALQAHASTKVFIWRVLKNVIPVYLNLSKRRILVDVRCPICGKEEESVLHIMWICEFSSQVFSNSVQSIQKMRLRFLDFEQLWLAAVDRLSSSDLAILATTFRLIWSRRNSFIFEQKFQPSKYLASYAINSVAPSAVKSLVIPRRVLLSFPSSLQGQVWLPPPEGIIKVNWDAGINVAVQKSGFRVVIRDHLGVLMAAKCSSRPIALDPTVAEAEAALLAVEFAMELGFRHIILEGDSLAVVEDILNEDYCFHDWSGVVLEIKAKIQRLFSCQVQFVPREGNCAAHCLAKEALNCDNPITWIEEGPSVLLPIIIAEKSSIQSSEGF